MTRVRYKYNAALDLYQSDEILTGNAMVRATYRGNDYFVIQIATGVVLEKGSAANHSSLVKKIKRILKEMGANFSDETRSKRG